MRHAKRGSVRGRAVRLGLPLCLALLAGGPALAHEDDRDGSPEELARVRAALEAKGYSDVHDLEVDDGHFEVDARNPDGQSVDLELDLETLEILHEDRD
jgi:hypothetical protein